MATMKDIAGLVGVSLTTVSNVVHGNYDRVSPQTVQRILAAIDELHYVPNMSARALVSHSSRIIAYVDTHSPQETYAGNGFAGVMLSGLESVVTDHGYFLMTRRGTDEDVLRLMLNNWNPDGVIFKDRVPQSLVDFVKKQGKPCVTINTYLDDPTLIQVRAEDRRGGYLAAKHLIDLGHRNILFIGAVHCGFMNNDTVERIDDFQLLDERFLSNPAFAVEQCKVVTDRMAELTREAIFDAIGLFDGGTYTPKMADRIEALETKIDHYEDKLGTYMVKLSRAKLSQKDGHTLSLLLHSISDFERISDHAVNLLDSAREMNEKKMVFSKAAASELHVFAGAVRDIINRSFDSFLQDDVELAKTVEPLEACIDDINVNVKSRHIERLTTGQCTIELGFVLTDISTNFERVSDHCSNIAVYQIQVPKDEYDAHEYLQNVKHQEHAEFDREEMAYEKQYRLPDVARVQTAKAGE